MRAISLTRVSSEEQLQGYSVTAQTRAIEAYCAERGWSLVQHISDDEGRSAWTDDLSERPGLRRALSVIESGQADVLIVHKLDRLARDKVLAPLYLRLIHKAGGKLVSLTEQWDFTTPQGDFLFGLMAGLNEYHSANLSTEVKKGKAERFEQGSSNGRAPYGYHCPPHEQSAGSRKGVYDRTCDCVDRDTPWTVCAVAAPIVRTIYARYAEGTYAISDIVQDLNMASVGGRQWASSSVQKILRNPAYAGLIRNAAGRERVGSHAAIVDAGVALHVRETLRSHHRAPRTSGRTTRALSLAGLLRCSRCQAPLYSQTNHKRLRSRDETAFYPYYVERSNMLGVTSCSLRTTAVPARIPEEQMRAILALLPAPQELVEAFAAEMASATPDDRDVRRQRLQESKRRLVVLFKRGLIEDAEFERDVQGIDAELVALVSTLSPAEITETVSEELETLADDWQDMRPVERRALLGHLLISITFDVAARRIVSIEARPDAASFFRAGVGRGLVETEPCVFAPV